MAQLNLIPGHGFVYDNEQDQLDLIPGHGFVVETAAAAAPKAIVFDHCKRSEMKTLLAR